MYKFNLQSVLDHRQLIEDNLKKEFSEIKVKVIVEEQLLEVLKRKEMKTIHALKLEQNSGISSQQVVTYHTYINRLFERMTEQEAAIDGIRAEEVKKHGEVLEAVKKRKILEKLKVKGIDRYRQMILDQETKFIDEIAVNQFVRKSIHSRGENE